MIDRDLQFGGFSAEQWIRLMSLWMPESTSTAASTTRAQAAAGTVFVILDDDNRVVTALHTQRGPIEPSASVNMTNPQSVCEHYGAARAFVMRDGAMETLVERAAMQTSMRDNYVGQWIGLLSAARSLAAEGQIRSWPESIASWRIPSAYSVARGLDAILPDSTCLTLVLWKEQSVWTSLCLSKRAGVIEHLVGPETLANWSGPLGGDYRRDYRPIARAISKNLAPLHLGVFAEETLFRQLLRDPSPGAWARAIAVRDVIVYPAPGYISVAVGADAMRAVAQRSALALSRIDFGGLLSPFAEAGRRALQSAPEITNRLGIDSLRDLGASDIGGWLRALWGNRNDS